MMLLLAQGRRDIEKLLTDLQIEARRFGLKLNLDKTKVLFLDETPCRYNVQLEDARVQVLTSEASERYLGGKFTVGAYHATELQNRIAAGWTTFTTFKSEMYSKRCTFVLRA
jgi:hypothetical protein